MHRAIALCIMVQLSIHCQLAKIQILQRYQVSSHSKMYFLCQIESLGNKNFPSFFTNNKAYNFLLGRKSLNKISLAVKLNGTNKDPLFF
jgi:hypothetical protein